MVLDAVDRGNLERSIDSLIKEIPGLVSQFRNQDVKKYFQYKDENDVVFGMILGGIIEKFGFYYNVTHNTSASLPETSVEIMDVITRRASEIRDAIFKCG